MASWLVSSGDQGIALASEEGSCDRSPSAWVDSNPGLGPSKGSTDAATQPAPTSRAQETSPTPVRTPVVLMNTFLKNLLPARSLQPLEVVVRTHGSLALAAFLALAPAVIPAQVPGQSIGAIEGRVVGATNGVALGNARVVVEDGSATESMSKEQAGMPTDGEPDQDVSLLCSVECWEPSVETEPKVFVQIDK